MDTYCSPRAGVKTYVFNDNLKKESKYSCKIDIEIK